MSNFYDALSDAICIEADRIPSVDDYQYEFSDCFKGNVKKIVHKTEYEYVGVGRHRIRKAVAIGLIAALIAALAACGAITYKTIANIKWNETIDNRNGVLQISFDVEKYDIDFEPHLIYPTVPDGFEPVDMYNPDDSILRIRFENSQGKSIIYKQKVLHEKGFFYIDIEGDKLKEITVNGYKGYWYKRYGENIIIWTDGYYRYEVGGMVSKRTAMDMSKKIIQ